MKKKKKKPIINLQKYKKKLLEINPHSKIILWQLKTTVPNYQDEGYIAKMNKINK
jgi:hypothetical protein